MNICPFPIAIMSFNRPELLAEVLNSLKRQTISVDGAKVYLFQDGAQSRFTQDPADASLQNECVKRFRDIFPEGQVLQSPVNLGIALSFDRAERLFFETLKAECGLFFEDDLFLSPHYLDALLQLANFAITEPLVAYVAAYGDHKATLASQQAEPGKIVPMAHNWAFALTRRQWLRQQEVVDGYLSIVRNNDYALRDVKRIAAYYASLGYAHPASSQDGAKAVASYVLGTTRLMSFSCFGHYIGKEGTHFNADAYNLHGYDKTELFDGPPPQFEFPSQAQLRQQVSDERAWSRRLLDAMTKQQFADEKSVTTGAVAPEIYENKYIFFESTFPISKDNVNCSLACLSIDNHNSSNIIYDFTKKLPFQANSVIGFQSQDQFQRINFEKISYIFDDIFRCLRSGGLFRLSLPDYNSSFLKGRSIYDADGDILYDLAIGGIAKPSVGGGIDVSFSRDGISHLWFPTYSKVLQLIISSQIRKCTSISIHHAWIDANNFVCREFDQTIMPVARTPPRDKRADGKPISIVVDFTK